MPSETRPPARSASRATSALWFGGAALFVALGVVGSLLGLTGARLAPGLAAFPVVSAAVLAIVGAAVGARLATAPGAARAIGIGVAAMAAGIVALAAVVVGLLLYAEPTQRSANLAGAVSEHAPLLILAVFSIAFACSPLGGLCGYAVWRRAGRRVS